MKNIMLIIAGVALLASCKTNQLYLNVLEPAPVTIPQDVKNAGIINRYLLTDESKAIFS